MKNRQKKTEQDRIHLHFDLFNKIWPPLSLETTTRCSNFTKNITSHFYWFAVKKKKKNQNAEEFSTEVENGQDCFFFWCCQVHNLIRQQHNKPIITRKRFFPLITYVHQRSGVPCQHDQIKEYSLFLTAPLLITYVSWPNGRLINSWS